MTVAIRVKGELEINTEGLDELLVEELKAGLMIPNEERVKALDRSNMAGLVMEEMVPLWRTEARRGGEKLLLAPRGTVRNVITFLQSRGLKVEIDDQRSKAPAAPGYYHPVDLRPYQQAMAVDMLKAEQGFGSAATGAGKSRTSLGAAALVGQRTLIIVDKVSLANQWRMAAAKLFGFLIEKDDEGKDVVSFDGDRTVGLIGSNVWEERDLTIALRQTLHERAWQLKATGWWETWGATFFDEAHHLSSETMVDIARCVSSFYLFGISATPSASEIKGQQIHSLVGPIVHTVDRQALYDEGILVKSSVEIIPGEFETTFFPDHASDSNGNCEDPNCRRKKWHRHQNNFSTVKKELYENRARNRRIAARILKSRGHVHLVASDQLKHLNFIKHELVDAGWPEDKIWFLRGEENAKGKDQAIVQAVMEAGEAVVLSTVAKEGLDVPPIDHVHVVATMKAQLGMIQLIGRGERSYPGKTEATVCDYPEPMDVLDLQFAERKRTYAMQGMKISYADGPVAVAA